MKGIFMGVSLASIHVYKGELETIKEILSDKYTITSISKDWVSIFGDTKFLSKSLSLANKLKRELSTPILLFAYHDDDMMELALYSKGERRASWSMHFGYSATIKKINRFTEDLGWDNSLLPRLRKISKCEDIDRAVSMLEEFFGVAFMVCNDFVSGGTNDYIRECNDKIYIEYIAEQKRNSKIKNKTKITLIDEMDMFAMSMRGNIFSMPMDDSFEEKRFRIAEKISDKVYDYKNPVIYHFSDCKLKPLYKHKTESTHFPNWIQKNNSLIQYDLTGRITFINENTQEITNVKLSNRYVHIIKVLDNMDVIFTSTDNEESFVEKADIHGNILWSYYSGKPHIRCCKVINDEIYALVDNVRGKRGCILFRLNLEGELLKQKLFEELTGDRIFVLYDKLFLFARGVVNASYCEKLIQLNKKLEIENETVFYEEEWIYNHTLVGYNENHILAKTSREKIMLINTDTGEKIISDIKGDLSVKHIDRHGNIIVLNGLSTIFILDPNLKILSRHRVKGYAGDYIENDEGLFIVASAGDATYFAPQKDKDCMVRIYKLEYLNII